MNNELTFSKKDIDKVENYLKIKSLKTLRKSF